MSLKVQNHSGKSTLKQEIAHLVVKKRGPKSSGQVFNPFVPHKHGANEWSQIWVSQ